MSLIVYKDERGKITIQHPIPLDDIEVSFEAVFDLLRLSQDSYFSKYECLLDFDNAEVKLKVKSFDVTRNTIKCRLERLSMKID